MSELFGNKVKPARQWAPVLNKGGEVGFSAFRELPSQEPKLPEGTPQLPKTEPAIPDLEQTLGRASRKPTILSAGQPAAAQTYSGSKLG